jgi:hypothetical protein
VSGYYESDPDEFERGSGGSGLRKQLEGLLEENKKLREMIEGDKRQETVTTLLKEKGVNPAVSRLIPSDVDPAKWLDENAELFVVQKPAEPESGKEENQPGAEPKITEPAEEDPAVAAEREARAAMQDAADSGSLSADVANDLMAQMQKINDPDELEEFMRKNGGYQMD